MSARNICRIGDSCGGHTCFPPRVNDGGSSDVLANGIGIHRKTDHWVNHTCGEDTHDSTLAKGSNSVFINGLACGRIGDPVACGSIIVNGSLNVFCGG